MVSKSLRFFYKGPEKSQEIWKNEKFLFTKRLKQSYTLFICHVRLSYHKGKCSNFLHPPQMSLSSIYVSLVRFLRSLPA